MDIAAVRQDLLAEQEALAALLAGLEPVQWALLTPSPGWTVSHQVAHLAYFDRAAAVAISDADAFDVILNEVLQLAPHGAEAIDAELLAPYLELSPTALLDAWTADRGVLANASERLGNEDRVAWFGPSMGSKSFLTARLMEAWAHGLDIADTVGHTPAPTDRLAHIARLGANTRAWSYINRGMEPPETPVDVRLVSPGGEEWAFGPGDASEHITGPAFDFCCVVAQRRHVDDTELVVVGDSARDWMLRAQLFAGGATDGPPPAASAPR